MHAFSIALLAGMSFSLFVFRFLGFSRDWSGPEAIKSFLLCTIGFIPMYVAGYGWLAIACILGERFVDELLAFSYVSRLDDINKTRELSARRMTLEKDVHRLAITLQSLEDEIEKHKEKLKMLDPSVPSSNKADSTPPKKE